MAANWFRFSPKKNTNLPYRLLAIPERTFICPRMELLEDRLVPAQFTVSSLLDAGPDTLRQAILDANATMENDTISFSTAGTITLESSLPGIEQTATAGTLTITGPGSSLLTISGDNGDVNRNFNIFRINVSADLTLSGVTVSGGKTLDNGGGVNNYGTLTISNSTIAGNSAFYGGGVYNVGTLAISNSTIAGNSAFHGGGVYNVGTLTINQSTIAGNWARLNGGGGVNFGFLTINNSTILGNSAGLDGGGIKNHYGTLIINQSTIAENGAIFGGGLYSTGDASSLTINQSTIVSNFASNDGGGVDTNSETIINQSTIAGNWARKNGGGVFNQATLTISHSIIANSSGSKDFSGTLPILNLNNLVADGSLSGALSGDPLLGPLQNNGGPTFTMALLPGSPAISNDLLTILTIDQRSFARTTNDIGAYSYHFASANDAVVSLDSNNQVVLTLASEGTTLSDVHTTYHSGTNTLTLTAATSGNLLTAPAGGIPGITLDNAAPANTITLDLNILTAFAGLLIVGNSGADSITLGSGGVDLSVVSGGGANQSLAINTLGALTLNEAIKTKAAGTVSLTAGSMSLAADVTTAGGTVGFTGLVALTGPVTIDTTNAGAIAAGAAITLSDNTLLNGYTLTLNTGSSGGGVTLTGNILVAGGILSVPQGDLNIGNGSTPTSVTFDDDLIFQVQQGALNVHSSTTIIGNNASNLTFQADAIQFNASPGSLDTEGTVRLVPMTNGTDIFLGNVTGTGINLSQSELDALSTNVSDVVVGFESYAGTITLGQTTFANKLTLLGKGGGAKVHIVGQFTSTAGDNGIGLQIEGSGHTTVLFANVVTAGTAILIDDAVEIAGANIAIDTTNEGLVPTGAEVILTGGSAGLYATAFESNNLTITAGTVGDVTLGGLKGFGNNGGLAGFVTNLTISAANIFLPTNANHWGGDVTLNLGETGLGRFDEKLVSDGAITLNNGSQITAFNGIYAGSFNQVGLASSLNASGDFYVSFGDFTMEGSLVLLSHGAITAQNINLEGVNASGFDLNLNGLVPGFDTGDIFVDGSITGVNRLNVSFADSVAFTGEVTATEVNLNSLDSSATFQDNLTVAGAFTTSSDPFAVTLLGDSNTIGQASLLNTENFTFGDSDTDQTLIANGFARTLPTLLQGALTSGGALDLGRVNITFANGNLSLAGTSVSVGTIANNVGDYTIQTNGPMVLGQVTAATLGLFGATSINQTGPWTVSGNTSIFASGEVTLDVFPNDFHTLSISSNSLALADSNDLILGDSFITKHFDLFTTGNVTQAGEVSVGGDFDFNIGGDITLTNPINSLGSAVSGVGANISLANLGTFVLTGMEAQGNLSLDTSGANANITQTGPLIVLNGTTTINAGSGSIVLTNPLNDLGDAGAVTMIAGNASLVDFDQLLLGATTVTRSLVVETPGALTQNAALVAGSTTLLVGGDVTLNHADNSFGPLTLDAANASLNAAGDLDLASANVGGLLNLNAGGDITQAGALTVDGNTTITVPGSTILLTNTGNNFSGIVAFTGANVDLQSAFNLTLAASSATGTLNLVGLNLSQTGPITAGGNTTLIAADITLSNDTNSFGGSVAFIGANVAITDSIALVMAVGNATGTLNLVSGGSLTQTGALISGGNASFVANGDIVVNNQGNSFGGTLSYNGTNLNISSSASIVLAASIASGNHIVTSGGSISQSGVLTVGGNTTLSAVTSITLTNAANTFPGTVAFNGTDVTITNNTAFSLATSNALGNVALTSAGTITQSGSLTVAGSTTLSATGFDITLTNSSNSMGSVSAVGSNISLANLGTLVLNRIEAFGNLSLDTSGANANITQTGPLIVPNGTTTINAGSGSIVLTNPLNELGDTGAVTITAGNASLVDFDDLLLGATTVTGSLVVETAGALTQNAALVAGSTTILTRSDVTLNHADNSFGPLTLDAANASLNAAGDLDLASLNVGVLLNLVAGGDITQAKAITIGGDAFFTGTNILLDNGANAFNGPVAFNGANVTLHGVGDLDLGQSSASGNLDLAGNDITQTGTLTVTGTSLLNGRGDVILNEALNDFGQAVTFHGVNVKLKDANDLLVTKGTTSVDVHLTATGSITELDYLSIGGWSFLNASQDILLGVSNTFVGQLQFTGKNVNLINSVPLMLGTSTANGALYLEAPSLTTISSLLAGDDANLTLNGSLVTGSLSAPNLFVFGATTINQFEPWTVPGITDVSATGAVVLDDPANDFGQASIRGTVVVLRDANDLILGGAQATNNLNLLVGGSLTQAATPSSAIVTGGNLNVVAGSDVTLAHDDNTIIGSVSASGGNIQLVDHTGILLGRVVARGNLGINTSRLNGSITQTSPLTVAIGTTTINAGTGTIILTNPLNDLGDTGAVTIIAGNASLVDFDQLLLGATTVTGSLVAETAGALTQNAALVAGSTTILTRSDVTLNHADNSFGPLTLDAANATINAAGDLDLASLNVGVLLNLVAGGDITQTGLVRNTDKGASATLEATGDIVLARPGNDFRIVSAIANNLRLGDTNSITVEDSLITSEALIYAGVDLFGGNNTFGGDVALLAVGLNYFDSAPNTFGGLVDFTGTEVYLDASGDILLDGGDASILLDVTSSGSIIQDPDNYLSISGQSTFSATDDIILDNASNQLLGPIGATGTNITLTNAATTTLADISATESLIVSGGGMGIAQSGTLNALGLATLSTVSGNIVLRAANSLAGVNLLGNDITLYNSSNLELGIVSASGNLRLTAEGSLTQVGPIFVEGTTTLSATTDIILDGGTNQFAQVVNANSGGNLDIQAGQNLVTGAITAIGNARLGSRRNLSVQGEVNALDTLLSGAGPASVLLGAVYGNNLTWNGPGLLQITGPQAYTSSLSVAAGTVQPMTNNLLPAGAELRVATGATFNLNGNNQSLNGLQGEGSVVLGTPFNRGVLVINNTLDALFSGVISGKGDFYKSGPGTQTLTAENLFDGFTYIEEGTVQLGDDTTNGGILSDVIIEAGTLAFHPGSDQTFNNEIISLFGADESNQSITLNSAPGAMLTIGGNNSFAGTTTILQGTLYLESNLGPVVVNGANAMIAGVGTISLLNALSGIVAPGPMDETTGTLVVTGDAVLGAESNLFITMQSETAFDILQAASTTIEGGNFYLTVDPSYLPAPLTTYQVVTGGPVSGRFSQGTVIVSGDYYFRAIYNSDNVTLQRIPEGILPGASPLLVSPGFGQSEAVIYGTNNEERARISPMGAWTGGMRAAVGDVTGDGFADFIFGANAGGGPRIVVIDGVDLQTVSSFFAYASTFRGGTYVAAGDINGDGVAEIVTGAGATGGPHVQSFRANGTKANPGFYAYASTFTGGVTVATGDLDGNNIAEIITGAATNGGSHVRSFSGDGIRGKLNFFAYASSFMGGVNVAAGDLNGDGIAEVITGAGASGGPNVKIFDADANQLASFYSYLPSFRGGVTVGVIDSTNSGTFSIVSGPGAGGSYYPGARVNLYALDAGLVVFVTNFLAYESPFGGGIWVA